MTNLKQSSNKYFIGLTKALPNIAALTNPDKPLPKIAYLTNRRFVSQASNLSQQICYPFTVLGNVRRKPHNQKCNLFNK